MSDETGLFLCCPEDDQGWSRLRTGHLSKLEGVIVWPLSLVFLEYYRSLIYWLIEGLLPRTNQATTYYNHIERSSFLQRLELERFPHAILLKVGLDFTLGGVLAPTTDAGPLDEKREFEYIPFPQWPSPTKTEGKPASELSRYDVRLWTYGELPGMNHSDKMLSDYLPYDKIKFDNQSWSMPENVVPHNDPNFRFGTSGEYWRSGTGGRLPKAWRNSDPEKQELWVFFKEALAPFTGRSDFQSMHKQQRLRYGFYIIGQMLVEEFVDIREEGWASAIERHTNNRSAIVENFHFRRRGDHPVIIVGDPDKTHLYKRAIPLKTIVNGQRNVTETGKLLNVTENDQVRFKYIYNKDVVSTLLDRPLE